jgi:alpha,alpha-trehalase
LHQRLPDLARDDQGSGAERRGYLPIEDYALIGDCHGAALVSRDGSIDWGVFERFDAAPTFSRLLDRRRGGFFEIRPDGDYVVTRRYISRSNVLETLYRTAHGVVSLTDAMIVPAIDTPRRAHLVRIVRGIAGHVPMRFTYHPLAGFAEAPAALVLDEGSIRAEGCPTLHAGGEWQVEDGSAVLSCELGVDQTMALVLSPADAAPPQPDEAEELMRATLLFWTDWTRKALYHGTKQEQVTRSALVLKAMTYDPTGAIVAAPTTSLPEAIGGVRNWDYRFCWVRDACLTFYALKKFGAVDEAERFFGFMAGLFEAEDGHLKPLYTIDGDPCADEQEITHFEGYRGSRPVRHGNEAAEQHQLDVYGQMLDLVYLYCELGGTPDEPMRRACCRVADLVAAGWREPDNGLWEPRVEPRRYLHAAIMNWVALDRAIRLFGERENWVRERAAIVEAVNGRGVHGEGDYLTQYFGGDAVDASVLIAPMVDFPVDRDVFERTVDRVIADLAQGPLVHRYCNDDGLPGEEGTFLLCAFWLVDALAWLGRGEEAYHRYEALRALQNDVGLYPEEIGDAGEFLGNFPQAFSHLGFLQTTLLLDLYRHGGAEAVRGTYADRAKRETPNRERPYFGAFGAAPS